MRINLANESGIEGQEENVNTLDNFRQVASGSWISESIEIEPGEDIIPRNTILDKNFHL